MSVRADVAAAPKVPSRASPARITSVLFVDADIAIRTVPFAGKLRVTAADQYPDLAFATLDVGKDGLPGDERVAGWVQGITRGFHQGRVDGEALADQLV